MTQKEAAERVRRQEAELFLDKEGDEMEEEEADTPPDRGRRGGMRTRSMARRASPSPLGR